MEKVKIEPGTVQETLLIPLYGRKQAMDRYPDIFMDHDCQEIFSHVDFQVSEQMRGKIGKIGSIMGATRNELLGDRERETNIACDLNDLSWFEQIDFRPEDGIVFFASGVFYYFKTEDVKRLFSAMAERFPGGKLVFDATKKKGLKSMLKVWLKGFEMKDISVYFSVDDVAVLKDWSSHIASVQSNGYLEGYRPLDKRFGFITNMVFRHLDKSKMCQIIEIDFAKKG